MAWVYILKSIQFGSYYIGSTTDDKKRIRQHINGKVKSTKYLRPLEVKLVQEYKTNILARRIEKKLKALKRKDYIDKIVREGLIKIKLPL